MDLQSEYGRQLNLWGEGEGGPGVIARNRQLMVTADGLNKQMGQSTVRLGPAGTKQTWSMRREKLSNRFTTRWDEILQIP